VRVSVRRYVARSVTGAREKATWAESGRNGSHGLAWVDPNRLHVWTPTPCHWGVCLSYGCAGGIIGEMKLRSYPARPQPVPRGETLCVQVAERFFLVQDAGALGSLAGRWDDDAARVWVTADSGIVGVATYQDGPTAVWLEVSAGEPPPELDGWDQVVEVPLLVLAGRVYVAGAEEAAEAHSVELPPGPYRLRVCFAGSAGRHHRLRQPTTVEFYQLVLWPAPLASLTVVRWMLQPGSAAERTRDSFLVLSRRGRLSGRPRA